MSPCCFYRHALLLACLNIPFRELTPLSAVKDMGQLKEFPSLSWDLYPG
jgi:hypothetical protein